LILILSQKEIKKLERIKYFDLLVIINIMDL